MALELGHFREKIRNIRKFLLEKDGEEQIDRSCEKEKVLQIVKAERNIIQRIKSREAMWIGHILRKKLPSKTR